MHAIQGTSRAAIGATLIFAVVAAVTMFVSPGTASAQPTLEIVSTYIEIDSLIGPISVENLDSLCPFDTHWFCDDFTVFGGVIDEVSVLAHIDSFILGTHISLLNIVVQLEADTDCYMVLDGPYLADYNSTTDLYQILDEVGSYSIVGAECDPGIEFAIAVALGSSPSSHHIYAEFMIEHIV